MLPPVLVLALLTVATCLALGADEKRGGAWDFSSRPAVAAKRKYEEAAAKAEQEYDRRMAAARDAAVKELNDAMRVATKAGDLEEANKIKQALADLTAELPPPGSGRGLVGRWEVRYTNGYRRDYEVNADGTVSWSDGNRTGRGKLQREQGGWLLPEDGMGNAERWTLAGDRVFLEHFVPKARYGKEPPQFMAAGERGGKKRK